MDLRNPPRRNVYYDHGTAGATETVDLVDGNVHDLTLDQPCTLTLTGAVNDQADEVSIILRGTFDVTWPGSVQWPGGAEPEVNTLTIVTLLSVDGGTTWYGFGDQPPATAFDGAKVTHGSNQAMTNGSYVYLNFDTEVDDTNGYHFTSSANLTGTVTKTASSATLAGSSTSFTTELSVGQMISVPGTAAEVRVVTAIASDTSLTVSTAFVNSASGQTAARVNGGLVARQAGWYSVWADVSVTASPGAGSYLVLEKNGASNQSVQVIANDTVEANTTTSMLVKLAQWDYIRPKVRVGAVSKNVVTQADFSPVLAWEYRGT